MSTTWNRSARLAAVVALAPATGCGYFVVDGAALDRAQASARATNGASIEIPATRDDGLSVGLDARAAKPAKLLGGGKVHVRAP